MVAGDAPFGSAVAVFGVALVVFWLVQMAQEVRQEIDALATANSDSTQWALAQTDVELLALKWAIAAAEADGGASIAEVRRRFDVLYSRIQTLSTSRLYAVLRNDPEVAAALARIRDYQARNIPPDRRWRRGVDRGAAGACGPHGSDPAGCAAGDADGGLAFWRRTPIHSGAGLPKPSRRCRR